MRILYLFPHEMAREVESVTRGDSPTERLYGMWELEQRGHSVDYSDDRFQGRFGRLAKWIRHYGRFSVVDWVTLRRVADHDVIVVKDDFSTLLTIACRVLGKKVVYLDSIFQLPRRSWRSAVTRLNLALSHRVVGYSASQVELWSRRYPRYRDRLASVPYTLDVSFYRPAEPRGNSEPYVLSVGRDLGRDFGTLVRALEGTGLKLKLVTLPYLLEGIDLDPSQVEVYQYLRYEDLFELYADALAVVLPLKRGITYPSGVRGMLEAMVLGKPVVATDSPALREYARDGEEVIFVEPEDPELLRAAVLRLVADPGLRHELAQRGRERVMTRYTMDRFVDPFAQQLEQLHALGPVGAVARR